MSLVFRLASRNLLHDRLRFVATVVGIVFSMVLVTVQIGLFLSFDRMVTTMIDHAAADLWIMPRGTKCFEDPSMLDERERFRALSINGVAEATPLVVGFAQWRLPSGGTTPVIIIGSDMRAPGLHPWNLVAGSLEALAVPDAVAVDQTYFDRLGTTGLGDSAEIRDQKAQVAAVTRGIRSFATTPYVFAPIERARVYMGTAPNKATYFLVRVAPNAHLASVRSRLRLALTDAEVLTSAEFRRRSASFWLFGTGAGAALFAGALLGVIVGTIIVAQTLYASTKDHLNEFATLRALGASAGYIHRVILMQAVLSAVIGYLLGMCLSLLVIEGSKATTLLILMTPNLALMLFVLTVGMCILAAICAIFKVTRIDPAVVFSR
jgi:putative ABC transport system permease protein